MENGGKGNSKNILAIILIGIGVALVAKVL